MKEFIYKSNVNTDTIIKNVKLAELNTKIASAFMNKQNILIEYNLIEYKCLCCNKNYQKKFNGNLKKRFFNTYRLSKHDINKFILLLQKVVYPYEYMDDWEKFSETSLPEKEDFTVT